MPNRLVMVPGPVDAFKAYINSSQEITVQGIRINNYTLSNLLAM